MPAESESPTGPRKAPSHYTDEFPELEGASWTSVGEKVVKQIQEVTQERLMYRKQLMAGTCRHLRMQPRSDVTML
jgi:hypothetical protein